MVNKAQNDQNSGVKSTCQVHPGPGRARPNHLPHENPEIEPGHLYQQAFGDVLVPFEPDPAHATNVYAARRILAIPKPVKIAAMANFDDDVAELKALGVHMVHNLYAKAGLGFAQQALQNLKL
jgi:hypothetical protein